LVIENLAFVIGEHRSENFAKNEELSEIALQRCPDFGIFAVLFPRFAHYGQNFPNRLSE
jgi:hypothetical protein